MEEYKLIEIGVLKYSRIKSISILKNELNSFGLCYNNEKTKELFDKLLNNSFDKDEIILPKIKYCLDMIFDGNIYTSEQKDMWYVEKNFPDNFIPPIG